MEDTLTQKLKNYHPAATTTQLIKDTAILVLVGPTGAGKDSLLQRLLTNDHYRQFISHTTRPPRINHGVLEQDGREYHFIDKPTAERMLDNQAFVEAKVFSGNLYGTSVAEVQMAHDQDKVAINDIEVQGVAEYKALDPNVMAVFLLPPDFQTWQERLQRRYGDVVDAADHRQRLEIALAEIEQLLRTDYYVAVINDDMETAVKQIETIVNSRNHTTPDEPAARAVAQKLDQDIKAYLSKTA